MGSYRKYQIDSLENTQKKEANFVTAGHVRGEVKALGHEPLENLKQKDRLFA